MNDNPLPKTAVAELRRLIGKLAQCEISIEKAKQAGIEIGDREERCKHLAKAMQQLLDVYGPNFGRG